MSALKFFWIISAVAFVSIGLLAMVWHPRTDPQKKNGGNHHHSAFMTCGFSFMATVDRNEWFL